MDIDVVQIPHETVKDAWLYVEQSIADALTRSGGYALASHIKQDCIDEKSQLWILCDKDEERESNKLYGVIVTEVIQRPLIKVLHIKIMTGRHREKWQHQIRQIEDFAAQNGCHSMELIARPGWKKILKPFDYRETHVVLVKQIKQE